MLFCCCFDDLDIITSPWSFWDESRVASATITFRQEHDENRDCKLFLSGVARPAHVLLVVYFRKWPCRERTRTKDMIVVGFGHDFCFLGGEVAESLFRVSDFDLPLWSACLVVNLFGSSGRFVHLENVAAEVARRMSPNSEGKSFFLGDFFLFWGFLVSARCRLSVVGR
jgi:hypothetical protein